MVTEEIQSAATVTYDFKGSVDYSMIKGLAAGQDDAYYESWFNDYIRVREIRDRMLGGHMVEEAEAAGAMPTTAYSGPDGAFNASVTTGTAVTQQPPPAAPQGAQSGQQGPPEWQSWPVMPDWHCDRDPSHEVRERPASGNAGRRAICHICKDELKGGRSAHHVVTGGWLDN